VQLEPRLRMTRSLWLSLMDGLHRRTEGNNESGGFLLGTINDGERVATTVVYYDDLDLDAYESGICVLHADAFGRLWDRCTETGLSVVADAHVHGLGAGQSHSDRENPMIALRGHLALIVPRMARAPVRRWSVGLYEYLGDHKWRAHGGCHVSRVLTIESDR